MNLPVAPFLIRPLLCLPLGFSRDIKEFIIDWFFFFAHVLFSITLFFSFLHSDLSFNKLQSLPDEIFNRLDQLNIL